MILYISSFKNAEAIEKAVKDSNRPVMDRKVVDQFDLSLFMKQQIDQLQSISILIIDLTALDNADEDIIKAISSIRMIFDAARIIFMALGREEGDALLSEIFRMGIYDIITGDFDQNQLIEELSYSITNGKTYRESIIYKDSYKTDETGPSPIKERVIIKNEIRTAVNKAFIGFIGTQERIGTTHTAIVCANYLKNKGFKIALIEMQSVEKKVFSTIRKSFGIENDGDCFNIDQIDYYPDFDFSNIKNIMNKKYNFVLIDFGTFKIECLDEFNRCVIPIVIAGTKPWEIDNINEKLFENVPEEDLKEYSYIFNFTDDAEQKNVREQMEPMEKIYFSGFSPDPFNSKEYQDLDQLFKGYIPETISHIKQPGRKEAVKEIINKCRYRFLKK